MQNNGLIRLFAILFGLVSIYQLSFTFITSQKESQAKAYATAQYADDVEGFIDLRDRAVINYLDSIGNEPIFGFTSYNDSKGKELNKGLDLKGGINVILQISVKDILKGLAENSKNPAFNQALEEADVLQASTNEPYIESFFTAFETVKGDLKLAAPDVFANRTLSDEINFQMTDTEVQPILRRKVDESIISAFEVLRKRIDKFGVTQPNIQRLGTSGRILVELPGAKDVDRVKNLLQSTAQLEFWETYKNDQLFNFLVEANEYLKNTVEKTTTEEEPATDESSIDDLLADVEAQDSTDIASANPLLDLILGSGYQGGPVLAQFAAKDADLVMGYLDTPEVRKILPRELRYIRFAWGKPAAESEVIELYALKSNRDDIAPLSGGVVVDAMQTYDMMGNPAVSMQMNTQGARTWEAMTGKAFREASNIAIVLEPLLEVVQRLQEILH
jgi:SecD/SecF fusion protein